MSKRSKERLKNEIKIKSIDSKAKISLMKEEIIVIHSVI